jgi:manganese transport protein
MAGQIVMEGFLNFRIQPWLRRLITRTVAIVPAAFTVYWAGGKGTYQLLILSQVILNMQLPFAVIPLIQFTSSRERMGEFANRVWLRVLAWSAAALILSLDIWLVKITVQDWLESAGRWRGWVELGVLPLLMALGLLLAWIIFQPVLPPWLRHLGRAPIQLPEQVATNLPSLTYQRILVPLDHTSKDRDAIAHAAALAKQHHATLYLLHVEEDVTSQVYGALASTAEVEAGAKYLQQIANELSSQQIAAEMVVRYSRNPKKEIVRYAEELKPDLVVMGAHGHKGIKDIVFGTTINAVRHKLKVPLLVVRDSG